MVHGYPPPATRRLIVLFTMMAAVMNQIDTTIANVALPHMQGTTSASREQISWVLTSYIVALAITTPLTGWLASRFGRRRVMLVSIMCFTLVSGLCGVAQNLDQLILFRLLQGAAGSALVPMSQATMLDITPPEEHGSAMAIFGFAAILGPLVGPVMGGWLTDNFTWRWVFYINLPIGGIAMLGLSAFMPEFPGEERKFDMPGFVLLALAVGAFQLMIDRGQTLDWFSSPEIGLEAVVAATCAYLFAVHVTTTREPFVRFAIFADRNFTISTLIGFMLGVMIYGVLSLLPPMLSALFAHPVMLVGLVTAPRGLGTFIATLTLGRLINRLDARLLVFAGLLLSGLSAFLLSRMSLQSDDLMVMASGFVNGMSSSMIFVPLATISFATMPGQYRNEAAAMSTLARYLGSSVGIAFLQILTYRNEATVQSRLAEGLRPDNPVLMAHLPGFDAAPLAYFGEMVRQATMVSYIDAFWILFVMATAAAPMAFLLKRPRS